MPVHRALGRTRRAGGVEPQGREVGGDRGDRLTQRPAGRQQRGPGGHGQVGRDLHLRFVDDDHVLELGCGGHGDGDRRAELRRDHQHPRTGVLDDLGQFRSGEHRGQRYGDGAVPQRAEDADRELEPVGADEHDAVAAPDRQPAQTAGEGLRQLLQLGVAGARALAAHGRASPVAAVHVPVDQVVGRVDVLAHRTVRLRPDRHAARVHRQQKTTRAQRAVKRS